MPALPLLRCSSEPGRQSAFQTRGRDEIRGFVPPNRSCNEIRACPNNSLARTRGCNEIHVFAPPNP